MEETRDPLSLFYNIGVNPNPPKKVGTDSVRDKRDQERRERLGQLRAREHPTKRPFGMVHQVVK